MSTSPKRALIVIDVQNEYVTGNLPIEYPPVQSSLANIGKAMDAANAAGIPVIVIQNNAPATSPLFAKGSPGWELHPTITQRQRTHLLNKTLPSAFPETDLAAILKDQGIDTLVVVGYMTHNCNASTINHALHMGLTVEFLADASGSVPYENAMGYASAEQIHRVFSIVFQSRFAAALSTVEWITALQEARTTQRETIYESNQRARANAALIA